MQEPSILDYVKAFLSFGRIPRPTIPAAATTAAEPGDQLAFSTAEEANSFSPAAPAVAASSEAAPAVETLARPVTATRALPWRSLAAFLLALIAQSIMDPQTSNYLTPAALYLFSAAMLVWAIHAGEWHIAPLRAEAARPMSLDVRTTPLYLLIPFLLADFLLFGGDRFNLLNVLLWVVCIGLAIGALWLPQPGALPLRKRLAAWASRPSLGNIRVTWFGLLLVGVAIMAVFFRYYQINQVPGQMFSDHAEKLLDIQDIVDGQFSIFFPRNTGREAIQMYQSAFIAKVLGFGFTFLTLKLGTILDGLLTLPFIYLLGKEVGTRWTGLLAVTLASFAYWPNVISRVALRFPLYPLFAAPMLFFLIRGLRTQNRNDFIWAGLALGFGLHGYSPMRIVPFIVVIAIGLYMLHAQSRGKRAGVFMGLAIIAFVSFVVFLPLFRYMVGNPEMFGYRAFTRLGTTESPLPGPALVIFFSNLWKASIMFWVNNGNIWVHSVTDRPALDVISAVFMFLGVVSLFVRYLRNRHWLDLFLILLVPLLEMPSILSLAFPGENPSLNRTGAAYIPVFVIAAIGLEAFLSALFARVKAWRLRRHGDRAAVSFSGTVVAIVALVLIGFSARQNYDLVFHQYKLQFLAGAWNTSDMGNVIHGFATSVGTPDTAYVVPYPYWVDTRLVGINAGYPRKDYALWPQDFQKTLGQPNPKLFLLKAEDQEDLAKLEAIYPTGTVKVFHVSEFEGKDFFEFFVPPDKPSGAQSQLETQP